MNGIQLLSAKDHNLKDYVPVEKYYNKLLLTESGPYA